MYRASVILRHGPSRIIVSDRGRQFAADVVEELVSVLVSFATRPRITLKQMVSSSAPAEH